MKTSHAGLGITKDEWEASLRHTRAALAQQQIADREQREFLALFERYEGDIVETQASPLRRAGASQRDVVNDAQSAWRQESVS